MPAYGIGLWLLYRYLGGWAWYWWGAAVLFPVIFIIALAIIVNTLDNLKQKRGIRYNSRRRSPRNSRESYSYLEIAEKKGKRSVKTGKAGILHQGSYQPTLLIKVFIILYPIAVWAGCWFYGSNRFYWFLSAAIPLVILSLVFVMTVLAVEIGEKRTVAYKGDLLPASLFVVFFVLFSLQADNLVKGIRSHNWPTTTGIVSYQEKDSFWFNPNVTTNFYSFRISRSYKVNARRFESDRVAFGVMAYGQYGVKEALAKFPTGSEVLVYYHPSDPTLSVLEPGVHGKFYLLFLLAIGAFFSILIVLKVFSPDLIRDDQNQEALD